MAIFLLYFTYGVMNKRIFFSFQQVVASDMGDSEDEYDRKRRDKFRGERTESYQRGEGRRGGGGEDRRREEWMER